MIKKIVICTVIFSISIFSIISFVRAQDEDRLELISLDFKGMNIRDVLKILSKKSGLNIVADRDVKGKVDLYLTDVDVMDALDIIVATNNLAYEQEGTLVRIMTEKKYEKMHGRKFRDKTKTEIIRLNYVKASDVSKTIKQMMTRVGKIIPDDGSNTIVLIDNPDNMERVKDAISEIDVPLVTQIFSLDYAKAESIKAKLEAMLSKNIGSINFDDRTNKLIVKDTPEKMEDIRKVVEAFDEKTKEVMIEANIIQITLSDKYSYGIDWADVLQWSDVRLTGDTDLSTGLTGTTPNTLTVATIGGTYTTVLSLFDAFGETNVLSRPRITVANKEEAKILVGAKEAYVTSEVTTTSGGTYHTTDHVQFVDVGVSLSVTPEINRAGYVKMKIKPEVSSADATKTVTLQNPDGSTRTIVPYVSTSEADTTVLVRDGTTIIIGGLMKDTIVDYKEKVPFLGDIPILGKLFSTTGKTKEKTELVILLTPHIIEGDMITKDTESYLEYWEEKEEAVKIERQEHRLESQKILEKRQQKPFLIGERTPYEEYYFMVEEKINNTARKQHVSNIKGEVELRFSLDREGFLVRGPVVLNKPDLKLVRAAVGCIKELSPFPPFLDEMDREKADFYVLVNYE